MDTVVNIYLKKRINPAELGAVYAYINIISAIYSQFLLIF